MELNPSVMGRSQLVNWKDIARRDVGLCFAGSATEKLCRLPWVVQRIRRVARAEFLTNQRVNEFTSQRAPPGKLANRSL